MPLFLSISKKFISSSSFVLTRNPSHSLLTRKNNENRTSLAPPHAPFVNMEIFLFLKKKLTRTLLILATIYLPNPPMCVPSLKIFLTFRLNLPVQRPDGVTWPITSYRSLKQSHFSNLKLSHGVLRLFLPHRVLTETIFF